MLLYVYIYFFDIFCYFHHKICVFIIFISFLDKVTNFRNRILTSQKRELMVSNCQRNCMELICYITISEPNISISRTEDGLRGQIYIQNNQTRKLQLLFLTLGDQN